jgi:CRISPR/Cas system-associated exonuclease Cas4 (RecB family)
MIALSYLNVATREPIHQDHYFKLINQHFQGDHETHLRNAVTVHLENLWQGCEVVAIEEPFVMQIDDQLPPCVGVIDLILKKDGNFILIDHKTGHDFYHQDELQMAIYVEYIKRRYGASDSRFYYEQYRWVNNLDRIRKPAFQRTEVILPTHYWQQALQRIQSSYQSIKKIKTSGTAMKNGECFRCPYRTVCWGG